MHLKKYISIVFVITCFSLFLLYAIVKLPRASGCDLKGKSDADCDGKITLLDFEIFRKELTWMLLTIDSDFNLNGEVDIGDFELWRNGYFNPGITLTPSAIPSA